MSDVLRIDFSTIAEPLDQLLPALAGKIRYDWPMRYRHVPSASLMLSAILNISWLTYSSVRFLCADLPAEGRQLELAVSIPPMSRSILDALFLVVFLFEDLPSRIEWYCKDGIREFEREYAQYKERYGTDPSWAEWLRVRKLALLGTPHMWEFKPDTPEQAKARSWWPHPGGMTSEHSKTHWLSTETDAYLTHLNDWFYRELSSSAHLSMPGLLDRSRLLFDLVPEQVRQDNLRQYRSNCVATTVSLLLALISELQIGLQFEFADQCKTAWERLRTFWGPAQDLYKKRYSAAL